MKKGYLFFSLLMLISFAASAQIVRHRSWASLEFRGLHARFDDWRVRYQPTDSTEFSGLDVQVKRARRSVMPFWVVSQEISFWNRLLVRVDVSSKFTRDNHFNIATGIGYQQPIAPYSRFPMFLRLLGIYEYWNYGVKVAKYEQGAKNLEFGKKEILANNVFVMLGNRQHIIRPQLGFSIQLSARVELAVEGFYCFVLSNQNRVAVRGQALFARHSGLVSTDDRLEVRDELNQLTTNWNVMDKWGFRLGIIVKSNNDK